MNPYLVIGLLVAWALSLVGADRFGYDRAEQKVSGEWRLKESKELKLTNAKILELNTRARELEASYGRALASVSTEYQGRLKDAEDQRRNDVAAVRARTIVLRDPGPSAGAGEACRGATGPATAATGGRDGETGTKLSDAAAEFLLELVADADARTIQLGACQAVIRADRGEK